MVVFCGGSSVVLWVAWAASLGAISSWVVDEDQVRRAGGAEGDLPARRDGMINSFRTVFSMSAGAWSGVLQIVLGSCGYDGQNTSKGIPQPEAVFASLRWMFTIVLP